MYKTLGCKDLGIRNQSLWQRLHSCLYDRKPKTSLDLLFQRRPLRQENIDDDVLNTNYFGEFDLVDHVFFHK